MSLDEALALLASFGHLTLAAIALRRRAHSPLAILLALLAIDCFAWNAADLAESYSPAPGWAWVDAAFGSLTMPLAFHFVLAFLGLARRRRAWIVASYAVCSALALANLAAFVWPAVQVFADSKTWSYFVLAIAFVEVAVSIVLLVLHLRRTRSRDERARAKLVMLALIVGTAIGGTDLWSPVHLGHVGSLGAAALFAVGVLRFQLLEETGRGLQVVIATVLACLALLAYLALFHYLSSDNAVLILSFVTITAAFAIAIATVVRGAVERREQLRYHATFGRWSAQMAHDLKNPLAAMRGALDFLGVEKSAGRSLDAHADYLELLRDQVLRIDDVVERYRRLSEVRAERREVELAPLLERAAAAAKMRGHNVAIEVDPRAKLVRVDPDLLASAVENLLKNAADASPDGASISVGASAGASALTIVVQDRGSGMNPRALERAGDDFYTTKAGGSGLGLAFARRVAEAHGGTLSIESEEDRGTTVRLQLGGAW